MAKKPTQPQQPKQEPKQDSPIIENSKITVTIPWTTAQVAYQKVLQHAAQHVKADGFRPGKVPPAVAEQTLKQSALFEETLREVLPAAYAEVMKAAKKTPISQPEVEPVQMEKGKDWVFTVYFAEQQPITLGKYEEQVKKALKAAETELTEAVKTAKKELTDSQKEDIKLKHVFKALIDETKPKIQEILVRAEVNRQLQQLVDQLKQLNLKVEDYLRSRQMTSEQLQQEYVGSSLATLQLEFVLAEVAKDKKLTVTDAEIDATFDKIGDGKLSKAQREDADYRTYLFSTLLKQKVLKHLLELS